MARESKRNIDIVGSVLPLKVNNNFGGLGIYDKD